MGHEAGWPCAEFTKSRPALQFHAARRKTSCGHCGKKRCDWCSWLRGCLKFMFKFLSECCRRGPAWWNVQIQINQSIKNQLGTKPRRRWPKQRETKRTRKFHWRCWALRGCWETFFFVVLQSENWSWAWRACVKYHFRYHFGSLCMSWSQKPNKLMFLYWSFMVSL